MAQGGETSKRRAAPYVSYQTFKSLIASLAEHVIPNRIDRSMLKNYSGAAQQQVMAALRFMQLMSEEGRPMEDLRLLVRDYGTENWPATLNSVLASAYPEMFEIQLSTASSSEFNEAFKAAYPCEGDTLRKGVSFFLNAGREAGISFSPFLLKNAKPRASNGKRRVRTNGKNGASKETQVGAGAPPPPVPPSVSPSSEDPWLAKYPEFDPSWPEEIKKSWFEGYSALMQMRKKSK